MKRIVGALALIILSACGDSDDANIVGPAAVNSVTLTVRELVLVGTTTTATAVANLSNGTTQTITSGFRSDAPAVATITDAGVVTGIANGEATIIVSANGQQATKRIRVAPNYAGAWSGMQKVTSCSSTGDLAGLCDTDLSDVGLQFPVSLVARQNGTLDVSGEFTLEGQVFPTFSTTIEGDGALRFTSELTFDDPEVGLTGIRARVTWQMNSSQNGQAFGTIREVYSLPGQLTGELIFDSELSNFNRSASLMSVGRAAASKLGILRKRVR